MTERAEYIRAIASKEHVIARLEFLKERAEVLGGEVIALRKIMEYEQQDVDRLEGVSGVSILYTLLGKKVEKLDKEKREALLAIEKFKLADTELKEIMADIEKCERELRYIKRCEEKYNELWRATLSDIASTEGNTELQELRDEALRIESRLKETEEAIFEGEKAFNLMDEIIDLIDQYLIVLYSRHSGYGETFEAYEKLKLADNKVERLPTVLSRFRAELSDVELEFRDDIVNESIFGYSILTSSSYIVNSFNVNRFDAYELSADLKRLKGQLSRVIFRLNERRERLRKNHENVCEKISNKIS